MGVLRIGTRRSTLAQWQAERVRSLLVARGVAAQLVLLATAGDEERPLPAGERRPAKGLFTKALEDALLDRRVDLAVHSLKDLMIELPAGLVLAAVPERADPRDAVVSGAGSGLSDLPSGVRVGTSSMRRRAALAAARPDVVVVPLRGNVPTRVARVDDGTVDAAVLAMAGLVRLGLERRAVPVDPAVLLPAPGQGALAVEARAEDGAVLDVLRPLDDALLRAAVEAERGALASLDPGCDVPIGAWCGPREGVLLLEVAVYAVDGGPPLVARATVDPADPVTAGRTAAASLLARGAAERVDAARHVRSGG